MPSNKVTIVLNAEDNASQKIRDVMRGIEQATTRGTMAGNLMGKAFNEAFNLAERAVGGLVSQLSKAEEATQQGIKAAQTYVNQFGGNLQKGQDAIYQMQKVMAAQAAALPGTAEDYANIGTAIFDNIAAVSANADEAMKRITGLSVKIGSRFTDESGVTQGQRIRLSERLLTQGLAIKNMERLLPIQQDAALRSAMRKAEIAFGVSFQDATMKQRAVMVESVMDYIQPQAVVDAMSKTYGSAIAQIQDKLFGRFGLFGVSRDLDLATQGEESVYTKAGAMMHQIISLGETLSKITDKLGLGSDPMAALGRGIDGLTKFLGDIDKALKPFAETDFKFSDGVLEGELSKNLDKLAGGLAGFINGFYEDSNKILNNVDTAKIGSAIGSAIGTFFGKLDYGKMFQARLLGWAKLSELMRSLVFSALEKFAVGLSEGIVDGLAKLFKAIDDKFGNIFSKIGNALGMGSSQAVSGTIGGSGAFGTVKIETKMPTIPGATPVDPKAAEVSPLMQLAPQVAPAPQISIPQGGGALFQNPVFSIQSNASDPRQVAYDVAAELGRQFQNYKLGFTG